MQSTLRKPVIIYQIAGAMGILLASWGRLDPTVLTVTGQKLPHWAVTNNSLVVGTYSPDSWSKMLGLIIGGGSFLTAYRISREAETEEKEVLRQLNQELVIRAIREQEEIQRQLMASSEMLKFAQQVERLRADGQSDEEMAQILGLTVEEFRDNINAIAQQNMPQLAPQPVERELDKSEPRIPEPLPEDMRDPHVYNMCKAMLRAMHKAGYYADFAVCFKSPSFIRFDLDVRNPKQINEMIDKCPTIIQGAMKLPKIPFISNEQGFLSVAMPRPDRETMRLSEFIDFIPAPKKPSLLLGIDPTNMSDYVSLDGKGMEAMLMGGRPRIGKTNLIKQMMYFAASNYHYNQVRFLIADFKQVELTFLKDSPYMAEWPSATNRRVSTTSEDAQDQLDWVINDMEERKQLLEYQGASNIEDYNALEGVNRLPYIVWIIDEFQIGYPELSKEAPLDGDGNLTITGKFSQVASIGGTLGYLPIFATQAPDKKILNRQITSKIQHRIALQLASSDDSKLILDEEGAEKLLDKGDCLSKRSGGRSNGLTVRLQSYYVENDELKKVMSPKIARLTAEQRRDRVFELRTKGKEPSYVIQKVWDVAEGDDGWADAQREYLEITSTDHPENHPPETTEEEG